MFVHVIGDCPPVSHTQYSVVQCVYSVCTVCVQCVYSVVGGEYSDLQVECRSMMQMIMKAMKETAFII